MVCKIMASALPVSNHRVKDVITQLKTKSKSAFCLYWL